MENLIDPAKLCFDDVQCQCRALAYAAYKTRMETLGTAVIYPDGKTTPVGYAAAGISALKSGWAALA